MRLLLHRVTNWEYWPMEMIYLPLIPVWLFYALRSGSLFFFTAANPSIRFGGMGMESKFDIYCKLKENTFPKTILIPHQTKKEVLISAFLQSGISMPCIVKPDIGMKGLGVEKIHTEEMLWEYSSRIQSAFLIQEFIPYQNEVGIFYIRNSRETKGRITGIVHKEFMQVTGNGADTLAQLIQKTPRVAFHAKLLSNMYANEMSTVIACDEKKTLVPFGSHTRGARFSDHSHLNDEKIEALLDRISFHFPDFHFGRLDIMYEDWEKFKKDEGWKIIEVNGAGSEPTHMYDPRHSLFFAMKEITRHWRFLFQISVANHKRGHSYSTFREGWTMIRESRKLEKRLKKITL